MEEIYLSCLFACFGGLTRTLVGRKPTDSYSYRLALGEVIISLFAGCVLYCTLSEYESIPRGIRLSAIGMMGFSAKEALGIIREKFLKKLTKEI